MGMITEPYLQLEREFGEWVGNPNMVACSSGTAALHLALESLLLPPGSEVLVPDFTMVACARAVTLADLTPVFVDCGDDLLMDPELLDEAWSRDISAMMLVHVYGRVCNIDAVSAADAMGCFIVEDCAECPLPMVEKRYSGYDPYASCYSFYRNKIVAGEEGGAVSFRWPEHANLAKKLRSLGFTNGHDFTHIPRGHNYRMSNCHAELVLKSLAQYRENLRLRLSAELLYTFLCPEEWRMPPRQAPWVYDLRIRGMTQNKQDDIVAALNGQGIKARHAFKPMSFQQEYGGCRVVGSGNALKMSREVIYLPLTPGEVTEESARQAFRTIKGVLVP